MIALDCASSEFFKDGYYDYSIFESGNKTKLTSEEQVNFLVDLCEKYPIISSRSKDILVKNTLFSIEPGYYVEGQFGLRIENLYVAKNINNSLKLKNVTLVPYELDLVNFKLITNFERNYIKKYQNFVLVFIKDSNLKSVTQTLKDYKNKEFYKKGNDKLIRNYGIGAQIIKDLKIKNMILITKSPKKVIGLDGYGIKITKQELI